MFKDLKEPVLQLSGQIAVSKSLGYMVRSLPGDSGATGGNCIIGILSRNTRYDNRVNNNPYSPHIGRCESWLQLGLGPWRTSEYCERFYGENRKGPKYSPTGYWRLNPRLDQSPVICFRMLNES